MRKPKLILYLLLLLCPSCHLVVAADAVLVEAESFENHGGWELDTQFIDNMGSPYLLAHGMGRPLADATTEVKFPSTGEYHVFVRTKEGFEKRDVVLGQRDGQSVEIVSGLAAGETIAVSNTFSLKAELSKPGEED